MSCVDYCTVLPSWEFDRDPACIVTYAFGKELDDRKTNVDEDGEEIPENYRPGNSLLLQCPKCHDEMGEQEPCLISVTCKPQYRVSVTGIHIISESRTVEVYDTSEGYLTTARGSVLQVADEEGGEQQQRLYKCKINLKDTLYGLSVKFLSLRGKDSFTVYNIMFILHPEAGDFSSSSENPTTGQINMNKVKEYITDMGDTIPDGARNLLQSMGEHQTNQQSAIASLQGLMSQGAPSSDKFGMLGLMSILSQVSNTSAINRSVNLNANQSSLSRGSQMTNQNVREREGQYRNRTEANSTENSENEDMFKMLQDICGKVSDMREKEKKQEKIEENPSVMYDESGEIQTVPCDSSSNEITTEANQIVNIALQKHLKDVEQRLTEHIDRKLTDMEEKFTEKLDNILSILSLHAEQNKKKMYEKSSQTLNFEDGVDE